MLLQFEANAVTTGVVEPTFRYKEVFAAQTQYQSTGRGVSGCVKQSDTSVRMRLEHTPSTHASIDEWVGLRASASRAKDVQKLMIVLNKRGCVFEDKNGVKSCSFINLQVNVVSDLGLMLPPSPWEVIFRTLRIRITWRIWCFVFTISQISAHNSIQALSSRSAYNL